MQGLPLLEQESLGRDAFAGDVFVFRGRSGSLIKALWHDGIGLSLYAKPVREAVRLNEDITEAPEVILKFWK